MRFKLLMILSLLGLLVISSSFAMAHEGDDTGAHHTNSGHMWDWWGIPFMGFWMVIIFVVQVVLAVLVYRDAETRGMNGVVWAILVVLPWIGLLFLIVYAVVRKEKPQELSTGKSAVGVLDERYARGEITREEYMVKKNDIERR